MKNFTKLKLKFLVRLKVNNFLFYRFYSTRNCDFKNQNFLDLFGKAKKKILKQDDVSDFSGPVILSSKKQKQEVDWGPQEIGM